MSSFGPIIANLARVTARVLVVTGARDALTGVAAGDLVVGHLPDAHHVTLELRALSVDR
jgi:hypothetical protein